MPVDQLKSLCQLCERIRQPSELGKHINNLKIDWKGELTYQRKMKFWRKWSSFCMLSNRSPLRLRSVKRASLFTRLIVSIFFFSR